ncbi:hypothetical protein [Bacillus sp. NSP9.1]|uniref:hypothetical protein n=1 Tax=Bacillus sp. NSP9.1 TaxID=1071078 RepID=UPI000478D979|nr:hypothetical protein [Bacillus sp. NSP9.1]QHZ45911.1 hypothetical protein M654_006080 [Bacillus sp. NSP9.1]
MSFVLDAGDFLSRLDRTEHGAERAATQAMEDNVDDLARIAQNIAPIKKGILRRGMKKKVTLTRNRLIGEVSFRAVENGFNYAIWTHEADYNLGPTSAQAGGTDGYTVGNKYLERPLKGEAEKYIKNVANAVGEELR